MATGSGPGTVGAFVILALALLSGCGKGDPASPDSTGTVTGPPGAVERPDAAGPAGPARKGGPGTAGAPGAAGRTEVAPVDPSPEGRRAAYERGLVLLRKAEHEGGGWGPPGYGREPGMTAMVACALLQRPGGPDPEDGKRVTRSLDFLLSLQKEDGGIYEKSNAVFTTSVAVEALAASGEEAHRPAIDRAVAFLRRWQFGEAGAEDRRVDSTDERYGGFAGGPGAPLPGLSDTRFAADALHAAGVPPADEAFQRMLVFLRRVQNRRENETGDEPREWPGDDGVITIRSADGGAAYRPGFSIAGTIARPDGRRELRSYGTATVSLVRCLLLAGVPREDPRVRDAVRWIRQNFTLRENPGFDTREESMTGYFDYCLASARAFTLVGDDAAGNGPDGQPRDWRLGMTVELLRRQRADGSWANGFDTWMEMLPAMATALALRTLRETLP